LEPCGTVLEPCGTVLEIRVPLGAPRLVKNYRCHRPSAAIARVAGTDIGSWWGRCLRIYRGDGALNRLHYARHERQERSGEYPRRRSSTRSGARTRTPPARRQGRARVRGAVPPVRHWQRVSACKTSHLAYSFGPISAVPAFAVQEREHAHPQGRVPAGSRGHVHRAGGRQLNATE
jgi:hypothetical protein